MSPRAKRLSSILCAIFLFLSAIVTCGAAPASQTVRVGWFPFTGYQEYDSQGSPCGYNYEYLTEIAEVTGWQYEFVDTSFSDALTMLKEGQIDLMGCLFREDAREEIYDFPDLDCGVTTTSLFVCADSSIAAYDFESFQGLRVGCCLSTNNDETFVQFEEANGFSVTLVDYPTEPELIAAVLKGEVAAGVASSRIADSEIRIVASFAPASFYFVTTKGNSTVLSGLNWALNVIKVGDVYHDKELSIKYDQTEHPTFSSLVNQMPTMSVAVIAAGFFLVALGLLWLLIRRARDFRAIRQLTYHDSLTGMYNKYGFEKRVGESLSHGEKAFALVAMDIEGVAAV